MIAWVSFVFTARSTPLTIWVPSSSATCRFFSSSSAIDQDAGARRPARTTHASESCEYSDRGMQKCPGPAESRCERVHGGAATPEGGIMADTSQPSFPIALTAVLAGGAISSWISAAFVGLAPETSVEALAILTSAVGAVFVKIVLR